MKFQYTITFLNPNKNLNITVPNISNMFILDIAKKNNIILPYSCKIGACSSCICKLLKGKIKHKNQNFLLFEDLKKKFILPCVAYATSNIKILTNMEDHFYQ